MNDSADKPALSPVKRALLALEEMQEKLRAAEQRMREPLAIIGMGCRFPGGVIDPQSCWELLSAGRDAVTEVPADRWDVDAFYDPDPLVPGKMSTRWGGFLDAVGEFDPELFGIAPREAQTMDPQQRLLLEVVWEALERAGQSPERLTGTRTGVFVGIAGNDYAQILARNVDAARIDAYFASGNAHSIASGRLSYMLGLVGPSLSIDTACSSSLVAVHQACQSVRTRESDMAIAAGVNLVLLPDHAITFSKSQMMAADGRCKTFDARADGFVRAEGCGVVLIKRLADAMAHGDPVLAVIRGTAINQDGASSGLTAPNGASQETLIRDALTNAGMRPDEIGYIEAHGTGTSLGDPIEVRALGAVFGSGRTATTPLYIGSAKTNFGHTEATAGIAGLIKAVLCLQNRAIPPSLHFETPNPHIAWEDLPIAVPTSVQSFPVAHGRRAAGVSSFGFSGTNAHVILEEAPAPTSASISTEPRLELLLLSAKSEAALAELAVRYVLHLNTHREQSLADICYTSRVGRSHFPYRIAIVARERAELREILERVGRGEADTTLARGMVSGPPGAQQRVDIAAESARHAAREGLLASFAQLYVKGLRIDWQSFDPEHRARRVTLPTYPFQRQRYWVEAAPTGEAPVPRALETSLLGPRLDSPVFSGSLFVSRAGPQTPAAFALDHRVFGVPILPGTGYIAMAFEAAAQVLATTAVRLTGCVFHQAMPVPEEGFREVQLVARKESGEARVEIFSRASDAAEWTRHATVSALPGGAAAAAVAAPLEDTQRRCTQSADREAFYADLRQRGLEFGPLFRGVQSLARGSNEALGEVTLPAPLHAEARHYAIHPVLLDACLQVVAAAVVDGAPSDAVFMPLEIESCTIEDSRRPLTQCRAHARLLSVADGSAEILRAELDVYDVSGARVAALRGIQFKRVNRATLARLGEATVDGWLVELTWEAARDRHSGLSPLALAANVRGTIAANSVATGWEQWNDVEPQLDRVCRGYIARAFADLGHRWTVGDLLDLSTLVRNLRVKAHYSRLLGRFLDILAADGVVRRDGSSWRVLRAPALDNSDAALASLRARYPAFQAEMAFTERCGPELAAALTGRSDPLHLLFPGGDASTAEHLYRDSPSARLYNGVVRDAVAAAVATLPADRPLRVLEIGGGTASTTSHVLPTLPAHGNYLFTDVSPLFVAKAAERFGSRRSFEARTLDIERDPREQGISGQFDIVIAANVLHATRDLSETFAHVRELLAPGGLLVCVEITRPQDWIDLSFGLTEGWWRFSDAQWRPEYPLLTTAQWTRFLTSNGFDEVASLPESADASRALTLNAVMLARARQSQSGDAPRRVLVLADGGGFARASIERLREAGHSVCVANESDRYARHDDGFLVDPSSREHFDRLLQDAARTLGGTLDDVLHFCSLDHSALRANSVVAFQRAVSRVTNSALHLAQALVAGTQGVLPSLWIVTRGGVALAGQPVEPLAGSLWGWARSLRLEHPELHCVSLDLDPGDIAATPRVILESLRRQDEELELAWRGGVAHVSRLRPARPAGGASAHDELPRHLAIAQRGDLDNLVLEPQLRRVPRVDEVEIRVRATGLNFRDVLSALGMYPGDPAPLGSELAGEVVAVGEGVQSVRVGDEVIALAADAFATHAIARAALVVPKPHELTFAQAAALPNALLTAHWALDTVGKMKTGERVLVHAAAGGVGLAAVQLARRAGAEIFVTAGSDEKRAYLRSLGIRHVFDSRSLGFSQQVLAATDGRGVDLVLNSLAGDFIGASLATLAPNGRFVEIGRTDVWSAEQVRVRYPGVQYHLIDLGKDYAATPERIRPLLVELIEAVRRGELQPPPMRTFALAQANAAFRHMAQARHIGKIVLTQAWSCGPDGIPVRADGTYWITGGLTGLGLAVAEWLVERGARHLALMGRRAPDEVALTTLARLRATGAQVLTIEGDVSVEADVARTREAIRTAELPPLAGILHAAGALDDGAIESQTPERYEHVFAAKMRGAWLLRSATREARLDFFVLFSSAAGLFGSAGQTNHGAASAYLDAFAHALRAEGVPAISIDWGAWSRIGAAAGASMGQRLREKGLEQLAPEEGLAAFGAVLRRAPTQIGVIAADWPRFIAQLPAGPARFMGTLATAASARTQVSKTQNNTPVTADALVARLAAAPADRRRALLQAEIRAHACKVLSLPPTHPVDIRSPLAGLGLDSLMAVELRNRLGTATGRTLPATLLFDHPTIEALCDHLAQLLEIAPSAPAAPPVAAADDVLGHVASLSEDELDRLLAAKMMAD